MKANRGHFYPNLNWDIRYGKQWASVRQTALVATNYKCCLCNGYAQSVHHSRYLGKYDKAGWNLFPLCDGCHDLSHHPKHWQKHPGNPLWKSCNTRDWEKHLRAGYLKRLNEVLTKWTT